MLEFKQFVFLDLKKTGSTFLREVLLRSIEEEPIKAGKHKPPTVGAIKKPSVMTIRDPHLYYHSLWSYGLDGRGVSTPE